MDAALDLLVGEESEPAFVRLDVHKDGVVVTVAEGGIRPIPSIEGLATFSSREGRSTTEVGQVMPERRKLPTICGHRIIGEMAYNDLPQPETLSWDSLVHSQPQLRLDFLELCPHAVAPGLPLKVEGSPARFTADERVSRPAEFDGTIRNFVRR
jgi:hypothetical protein